MEFDEKATKDWLLGLLPEGWSRQDIADELGVERRTISTMLNPSASSFGQGRILIRYLQLVGGLNEAPAPSPAHSRLAVIEAKVDGLGRTLDDVAAIVREHLPRATNQGQVTEG